MGKRLPLEVEFLQREREAILKQWRSRLESGVNSHFFVDGGGFSVVLMGQIFDDIVNAIDKNLYRNLNLTFDTLLRDGRQPALPVSDVRDFIFEFIPAARAVLEQQSPNGSTGSVEVIYQRFKAIERDIRQVYSERMARNLIGVMEQHRHRVLDTWVDELPTPIISDHFSVLGEADRCDFIERTYDVYLTMLRGEEQEMVPAQSDAPPRTRLNSYIHHVVEFYEPKGFLISDMQRALNYPLRLIEPRLFHKFHNSVSEYRVALLALVDVLQTLTQAFCEAYTETQMKNYYNEVSMMLHRIKNKLTAVPTTMETILMIPKEETEMAGDPMVITTPEAETFQRWLEKTDELLGVLDGALEGGSNNKAAANLAEIQDAWISYRGFVAEVQPILDNVRYKLDPGTIDMVNELFHIVYEGGKLTTDLTRELQIRQNELYQREPPKRKEMDIYTLVKRAYEESVPEAHSRNINYELIAEDRGIYVFGVEAELKRPFIQVIENAIKYTPEGGNVTVKLEYEPQHILFSVTDSGIGIPPGEEEQVFGLCERCSNAKDFNKAGTGTGLYNDRKIILHHNGKIWVESPGINQGSTFFIRLPVHQRAGSAGAATAAA